jgi:hypothetical protein
MRFGIGKWIVTLVSLLVAAGAIVTKAGIKIPYADPVLSRIEVFWLLVIAYVLLLFANFIGRRL